MMEVEVEAFAAALKKASRAADNTVTNYRRDLLAFRSFMLERAAILGKRVDEIDVASITADHLRSYLAELMKNQAARATVQRRLSAIKAFFRYRETTIGAASPARTIRSPKNERRLPSILQESEVRRRPMNRRRLRFAIARSSRRFTRRGCGSASWSDSTGAISTKSSGW